MPYKVYEPSIEVAQVIDEDNDVVVSLKKHMAVDNKTVLDAISGVALTAMALLSPFEELVIDDEVKRKTIFSAAAIDVMLLIETIHRLMLIDETEPQRDFETNDLDSSCGPEEDETENTPEIVPESEMDDEIIPELFVGKYRYDEAHGSLYEYDDKISVYIRVWHCETGETDAIREYEEHLAQGGDNEISQ